MFCPKCGATLPVGSKFCSKCGTKVIRSGATTGKTTQTNSGLNTYNDSTTNLSDASDGTFNTGRLRELATTDKILGIIATFFLLLVMVVPFVTLSFFVSYSFTLFGALDGASLMADNYFWKTVFILAYIACIALFAIGKFTGRTRVASTWGCVGSWLLLVICIILVIVVNSNTYSGMLTLGFGFYVWIIANILEIVSLCMDARKPDISLFA